MQKTNITLAAVRLLHQAGQLDEAREGYLEILRARPNFPLVLNNLGTIFYTQNKLPQAIQVYKKAIAIQPNYVDAYYNLSLALIKQKQLDAAMKTIKKLLTLAPKHDAARFHLANIYMQQEKMNEAISEFLIIEAAQPYHFETLANLATCYLKQKAWNVAKQYYLSALTLMPQDEQCLFNLAIIHMQLGQVDLAIQYYQRTLQVNEQHFAAHNNLAVAFLFKQHFPLALQHFKRALALQPDNQVIAYTINALAQQQPLSSAPATYIQTLFDAYADHYDTHLVNALDYQLPQHFKQMLEKFITTKNNLAILDLGCGTGLCGSTVKAWASTLIGVDLSAKMLEMARTKQIYDQLIQADIIDFLHQHPKQYDLIIVGDVLVYHGALDTLFAKIATALHPKGLFIFNTEISQDDSEFTMTQSGRFSHHKNYLNALANQYQFEILDHQTKVTRVQNNQPVYGYLYLLRGLA